MKAKILICLDKIKHPNSGLGRITIDYLHEIIKFSDFEFTFLVPPGFEKDVPPGFNTIRLSKWKRFFSSYMRDYDLVHILHQLPSYSLKKAKKLVLTVHDLNFLYTRNNSKKNKYLHRLKANAAKANVITFISHFTENDFKKHLPSLDQIKTKVIYNGSNQLATMSSKPDWCSDKFIFSVGIFSEKKNFHSLLPFMKMLPADYKLIIAGNSNTKYGDTVRDIIHKLNLSDRVILPGMISEEQKSYLYHHCEAFVFPSIAEGFGLPVIEAMSIGKPVFCSNKTSLKEIGDKYAYFWHHFDPEYMKEIFDQGLTNFASDKLKKQDQITYARSYSWNQNATKYNSLFKELLNTTL